MRIFMNLGEAYPEIKRDLNKFGVIVHPNTMQDKWVADDDDYMTKETQLYTFCILDTTDHLDYAKDPEWCAAEFAERIDTSQEVLNPGYAYKIREVWEEFVHDGKFGYTYHDRMAFQVQKIIDELKRNLDSRQLIVQIFDYNQDNQNIGGAKIRIPCSMYYQLMYREGKLDIIYNMRSCDFSEHFTNDVSLAMMLQHHVAKEVGIEPGKMFYSAGSFHIYKKDWEILA